MKSPLETPEEAADRKLIADADSLAAQLHAGQHVKAGRNYIAHPRAVIAALKPFGASLVAAGLLHDTIENCDVTADDLRFMGIPDDVVLMVLALVQGPQLPDVEMMRLIANPPGFLSSAKCVHLRLDVKPPKAALIKLAHNAYNARHDLHDALDDDEFADLMRHYAKGRTILLPAVGKVAARIIFEHINPDLLPEADRIRRRKPDS